MACENMAVETGLRPKTKMTMHKRLLEQKRQQSERCQYLDHVQCSQYLLIKPQIYFF